MVLRALMFGLVALISSNSLYELNKKKVDKVLDKIWEETSVEVNPINSNYALRGDYYELKSNEETFAYMVIDKAKSKVDEFTYMVLFNTDASIQQVSVLQYRENYGGEIASKRFLKQYIGKTAGNQMEYLKDIDGISGATISVRSINRGVKRNSEEFYSYLTQDK